MVCSTDCLASPAERIIALPTSAINRSPMPTHPRLTPKPVNQGERKTKFPRSNHPITTTTAINKRSANRLFSHHRGPVNNHAPSNPIVAASRLDKLNARQESVGNFESKKRDGGGGPGSFLSKPPSVSISASHLGKVFSNRHASSSSAPETLRLARHRIHTRVRQRLRRTKRPKQFVLPDVIYVGSLSKRARICTRCDGVRFHRVENS